MDEWFLSLNLSCYLWFDPVYTLPDSIDSTGRLTSLQYRYMKHVSNWRTSGPPKQNGPMDMGQCLVLIWQRLCIQLHFCWYPQSPNRRALGRSSVTVGVFGCNFWWCQVGKKLVLEKWDGPIFPIEWPVTKCLDRVEVGKTWISSCSTTEGMNTLRRMAIIQIYENSEDFIPKAQFHVPLD